jgi:hypothetical protein
MKNSVRAISVAVGLFCAAAAFAQVPAPAGVSVPAAKAAATTAATNAANTAVGNATASATTAATNAATNAANKVVAAPAAAPAPVPAAAPAAPAAKVEAAKTAAAGVAAGGGAGKVWVNAKSKVYHCEGTKSYGTTKNGEYMTEAEAKAKGNHGVKGKSCAK